MTQLLVQGATILAQGPFTDTGGAINAPDAIFPKSVLGAYSIVDADLPAGFTVQGYTWNGSAVVQNAPPPAPVPEIISPRQFRQSLTKYGFRTNIENAISTADQDTKDWYEYATQFERHHPRVLAMAQQLGYTSDQLDQVWTYGATI